MARIALALAAAVTALLASVTVASGNHSNGNGPKMDLVAGTASQLPTSGSTMIHVNAQNDNPSNPSAARGHFLIREPATGVTLQGNVICLNVMGNAALLVGDVTKAKNSAFSGFLEIEVIDAGEPGTFDMVDYALNEQDCEFDDIADPIARGNFIVHDQTTAQVVQSLQTQIAAFEEAAGAH